MNIKIMNKLKYIGIIPTRYASTRFPGKPLVKIGGIMMIERVFKSVLESLDFVVVATDDKRIFDAVESFGGRAVMTSPNHKSGTDRCLEAYNKIGIKADVIINIQGDEPFITKSQLHEIKACFDDENVDIATLARPVSNTASYEDLANPNTPKIILNNNNYAMYFSRSVIPYLRNVEPNNWSKEFQYYGHIGMYAYKTEVLKKITTLPQSSLEKAESLEQLRWLQNGFNIKVGITESQSIGIDTPQDVEVAEKYLNSLNK